MVCGPTRALPFFIYFLVASAEDGDYLYPPDDDGSRSIATRKGRDNATRTIVLFVAVFLLIFLFGMVCVWCTQKAKEEDDVETNAEGPDNSSKPNSTMADPPSLQFQQSNKTWADSHSTHLHTSGQNFSWAQGLTVR